MKERKEVKERERERKERKRELYESIAEFERSIYICYIYFILRILLLSLH